MDNVDENKNDANTGASADANTGVKISVTCTGADGHVVGSREMGWFNTFDVIEALDGINPPDWATVDVVAELTPVDGSEVSRRVLFSGTAEKAREDFGASSLETEQVIEEMNKFITVLMSHSRLRGVMVALVCADARSQSGTLAHGFARTSNSATAGDFMVLYSTNVANGDKFARATGVGRSEDRVSE